MSLFKKIVQTLVGDSPITFDDKPGDAKPENKGESDRAKTNHTDRPKRDNSNRSNNRNRPSQNRSRNNRGRNSNPNQQANPARTDQPRPAPPTPRKVIEPVDPVGFKELGLRDELLKAVGAQGYANPTPIQQASIASLIEGRDLLGCAQTGTGKTAAFALPSLQRMAENKPPRRPIRTLVLTPTRELALQVSESFGDYGRYLDLTQTVIFGGVGAEPQRRALKRGIDTLVATPGRLLDLHSQGFVHFDQVEIFILDEADRMLDMGFLPDVKRIIKLLPRKRQNVLFSATMPKDIEELSMNVLNDPVKVEVARVSTASERVEQSLYLVNRMNKRWLLLEVLKDETTQKVILFTRTKAIANKIVKFLAEKQIGAEAIHGNKSQSARQRALENFKDGRTRVLVASDLAARGLDVDDITHVINYDLPNIAETYVHRIGRTGRADALGKAISFCDDEERAYLRDIEKLLGNTVPVVEDHPFPFEEGVDEPTPKRGQNNRGRRPNKPGNSGGGGRSTAPKGRKTGRPRGRG